MEIELIECFPGSNLRAALLSKHQVEQYNWRKTNPRSVQLQRLAASTIYETPADEVARRMKIRNQKLLEGVK